MNRSGSTDRSRACTIRLTDRHRLGMRMLVSYEDELLLVPPQTQGFAYDDDGNLTADNLRGYVYDAENRLVQVYRTNETVNFKYDYMGRRVEKQYINDIEPARSYTVRYVWQGWTLIAELNTNGAVKRSYDWGLDLSGSLGGAGGIGGLLAINESGNSYLASYDGNGNVSALIRKATGTVSAAYEYDPYGNVLRKTGEYADRNPYRFSTKYYDEETKLSYYGFRYYSADMGRFINRDLIEEQGAWTIYRGLSTSTTVPSASASNLGGHSFMDEWRQKQDALLRNTSLAHSNEEIQFNSRKNSTKPELAEKDKKFYSANATSHMSQGGSTGIEFDEVTIPSSGYSGPSNVDINLYIFVGNNPVNAWDLYGLKEGDILAELREDYRVARSVVDGVSPPQSADPNIATNELVGGVAITNNQVRHGVEPVRQFISNVNKGVSVVGDVMSVRNGYKTIFSGGSSLVNVFNKVDELLSVIDTAAGYVDQDLADETPGSIESAIFMGTGLQEVKASDTTMVFLKAIESGNPIGAITAMVSAVYDNEISEIEVPVVEYDLSDDVEQD